MDSSAVRMYIGSHLGVGLKWLLLVSRPPLLTYETCDEDKMVTKSISTFLTIFGVHMNIICIIKVKVLVFINRQVAPPPKLC